MRPRILCALLALALLPACPGKSRPASFDVAPNLYPDGPEGLKALWSEVLKACKDDDRNRVHDLLASMALSQAELGSLFGDERAAALWSRYQALIGSLANVGAIELVAKVYEKKYDDIAVVRVDTLPKSEQQETDQHVLAAFVRPVPLYTVRVKKKDEARGLRYDFFVYLGGRWRTGNLLGKTLVEEKRANLAPAGVDGGTTGK